MFDQRSMLDIAKGLVPGHSQMNKYGHNEAVATGPEDVWGGGGLYAFYFIANQTVDAVSTDVDDVGSEVEEGTVTGGSVTTLVAAGADFSGVTVGDVVINDTTGQWGTVNAVTSSTELAHTPMTNASSVSPASTPNAFGHAYRIGSSADTGAGVIHVEGLTDTGGGVWEVATETIILNGQTEVAVTTTFVRLYRAFVLHAGSSGMNEGGISVAVVATSEVGCFITAGDGQTQQAIYTIPSGKTGYFMKGYVGVAGGGSPQVTTACVFTWRARINNGATGVFSIKGQVQVQTNSSPYWIYEYAVPVALPEKTDLLIRADSTSAEVAVVGAFDIVLVDN
jgi:hypothetical protein